MLFRSIQISQTEMGLKLHQRIHIDDLLVKLGMENANGCKAPMEHGYRSQKLQEDEEKGSEEYCRSILGSLLYISGSVRPDISFACNVLARHVSNPALRHQNAAKRIVRYLSGTKEMGIIMERKNDNKEINLTAFCDSDYAEDLDDGKSTAGYVIMINNWPVIWRTKKHNCLTQSSVEAEYLSASEAEKEIIWLRKVVESLLETKFPATTMFMDNQGAICIANGEVLNSKLKHVDVRHHYVKECVRNGEISLQFCPSNDNVADTLTKALAGPKFCDLRERIGIG